MFTERKAIEQRMTEIKEERRALHDEYYRLLDRLRRLDQDTAEQAQFIFTADYAELMDKLSSAVEAVANLVPSVTPAQVIEKLKEEQPEIAEQIIADEEPKLSETEERIAEEMRKKGVAIEASEEQLTPIKPKEAEPIIVNILKEEGIPLTPMQISERLQAKGYEIRTPIHTITNNLKKAGRIESPSYGFWQVKRQDDAE